MYITCVVKVNEVTIWIELSKAGSSWVDVAMNLWFP